jgi:hypothetical protein
MNPMHNEQPTPEEWSKADVTVIQEIKEGRPPIIGLRKNVRKDDVPYSQTVWLTPPQLRGLAIDVAF